MTDAPHDTRKSKKKEPLPRFQRIHHRALGYFQFHTAGAVTAPLDGPADPGFPEKDMTLLPVGHETNTSRPSILDAALAARYDAYVAAWEAAALATLPTAVEKGLFRPQPQAEARYLQLYRLREGDELRAAERRAAERRQAERRATKRS